MHDPEAEHTLCGVEQEPYEPPAVFAHAGAAEATAAPPAQHEPLPPGWVIWLSPGDVSHAIDPQARCVTCGKHHDIELDVQVQWLYDRQHEREAAVIADAGRAALEAGAWVDQCRDVLTDAPAWVRGGAMREYLRCNGLDETLRDACGTPITR